MSFVHSHTAPRLLIAGDALYGLCRLVMLNIRSRNECPGDTFLVYMGAHKSTIKLIIINQLITTFQLTVHH
jgi:hypothetical protein